MVGVGLKMEESSGAAMIRLTSSNYSIWKPRMEDILYCKDLYAPIDGDKSKPKDMLEAEWKIMNSSSNQTVGRPECVSSRVTGD